MWNESQIIDCYVGRSIPMFVPSHGGITIHLFRIQSDLLEEHQQRIELAHDLNFFIQELNMKGYKHKLLDRDHKINTSNIFQVKHIVISIFVYC